MAASINDNRWTADPEQFAARVDVNDVPALFSRQLIVEPGTRALIIDSGQYLGDVGPGTYVMKTFAERLAFWHRKQATVILTRQEDFPLEMLCTDIPTAEHLTVNATVRLAIQIEDVALFMRNLMGTRPELRANDLRELLSPILWQSLWEAIGRMSIKSLTGPEGRAEIDALVEQSLSLSMRRYGLRFVRVQLVDVDQEKYEALREKHGESWLEREELVADETRNELAALADKIAVDRQQDELAVELRRIGVRNELRAAVRSEEFDKISDQEQLSEFLLERDQAKLIRHEERTSLVVGFNERKQDRQLARRHLLAKLELERDLEIERVREQLDHAAKMKRLEHEIEITRRTASKENVEWQHQVETERREAEHRYLMRGKELKQTREWALKQATERREDEWADLVHLQQTDRVRGEIEVAQSERRARLTKVESELKASLATDELETERRHKEFEREESRSTTDDQIDKLKRTQELNVEAQRHEMEMYERRNRLETELEELKSDKASQRELARLSMMKGMSTETLIVTGETANAAILADLKKHQATQDTIRTQAESSQHNAVFEEKARSQAQIADERQTMADQMAAMYKDLIRTQQAAQDKTLDALTDVARQSDPAPPIVVTPVSGQIVRTGGAPAGQQEVMICTSCSTENEPADRYCKNCGKKLFP